MDGKEITGNAPKEIQVVWPKDKEEILKSEWLYNIAISSPKVKISWEQELCIT